MPARAVRMKLKSASPWVLADIADKNMLMMSKAAHDEDVDLPKTIVGTPDALKSINEGNYEMATERLAR